APCGDQLAAQAVCHEHGRRRQRQQHLVEPHHPVAAPRPLPVVLLDALPAVAALPMALPVAGIGIQPAGQQQHAQILVMTRRHAWPYPSLSRSIVRERRVMKHVVFVDGQEGTTGLRIHEYLAQRSDVELLKIDAAKRKDNAERARLLNAADVAFLCLPDAAAREAAALVTNPKTCLIDASTAHRTAPGWTFGLPELAPSQ